MSGQIPRRRWIQSIAATIPAAAAVASQQSTQAQSVPATAPPERPNLEVTGLDSVGEPALHFFSKDQFAALRKLGDLLFPQHGPMPGAIGAEAPEFLDFYLSQSPAARQKLYRTGLDRLSQQGFSEMTAEQAKIILAPLNEPWTYNAPKDDFARFLREAKDDFFRATMNSKQFADAQGGSRRSSGQNPYWHVLD